MHKCFDGLIKKAVDIITLLLGSNSLLSYSLLGEPFRLLLLLHIKFTAL